MRITDLAEIGETSQSQLDRMIAAADRYAKYSDQISQARSDIAKGFIEKVETPERRAKFVKREVEIAVSKGRLPDMPTGAAMPDVAAFGLERMLGGTRDFLSIEFFEAGLRAAHPVGRLQTPLSLGTGFLVTPGILLTNNHVLPDEETAGGSVLEMDAEENRIGDPKAIRTFRLDPGRFFATDGPLDFTFVAVSPEAEDGTPIDGYGCHPLIAGEGKILVGHSVNIVQHPAGRPKSVVVHNSKLIFLSNEIKADEFCYYTSDTDEGSSGAPVFNNHWEVIALHHSAVPKRNSAGQLLDRNGRVLGVERARENPQEIVWVANEGVRTSRLVKRFGELELEATADAIRAEMLEKWKSPPRPIDAFHEAKRRPAGGGDGARVRADGAVMERRIAYGGREVTIPVNITVRIGEATLRDGER
jgi:endonuclease G